MLSQSHSDTQFFQVSPVYIQILTPELLDFVIDNLGWDTQLQVILHVDRILPIFNVS